MQGTTTHAHVVGQRVRSVHTLDETKRGSLRVRGQGRADEASHGGKWIVSSGTQRDRVRIRSTSCSLAIHWRVEFVPYLAYPEIQDCRPRYPYERSLKSDLLSHTQFKRILHIFTLLGAWKTLPKTRKRERVLNLSTAYFTQNRGSIKLRESGRENDRAHARVHRSHTWRLYNRRYGSSVG